MRIAIVSSYTKDLINFRRDMIQDWIQRGHEVFACGPVLGQEDQLKALEATFEPVHLVRTGLNPFDDLVFFVQLTNFFRKHKPEIVFSYNIKPVIYGSLAASFCSVPNIFSMITGAGYAFEEGRNPFLIKMLHVLYKAALKRNTGTIFQNPDDINTFKNFGLVEEENRIHMVNGSGVNLENFYYSPPETQPLQFLMICRLIPEKGVREYAHTAREIKKVYGEKVSFGLLGALEKRPDSIPEEEVFSWQKDGIIKYFGRTDDVRPFLLKSSVYVFPSYYREGVPRSTLEAMAMGRPIITTDSPGCRETVINGVNGFLVPPKDSSSLAKAIQIFIDQPELIHRMGLKSRELAEKKFDVKLINQDLARILDL